MKAVLLLWKKLSNSLKQQRYIINSYDWCVANKDIDRKQCTIIWHVDDLKISDQDPAAVDKVTASLSAKYGQVDEMAVRRGKKHNYLGMTLDFSEDNTFIVDIEAYLDKILCGLP